MRQNFTGLLAMQMNARLYFFTWLILAGVTFLLLSTVLKTDKFYYDAAIYFDLSTYFFKSFTDYNNPIRGYSFPLLLSVCHIAAKIFGFSALFAYNVFASAAHSFFIAVVLPLLIKEVFGKEIKLYMIVVFYAMIVFFWYGMIVFPLTDLWAIYFLCSAILIVKTRNLGLWRIVPAGILIGLTSNVRPIYLCVLPLFVIYAFLQNGGRHYKKLVLPALALGIFLAWLPQIVINKTHFGTYSPMIQTHVAYGGGLYFTQLNLGFSIEKYETLTNNPRNPEVHYLNPKALSIIEKENLPRNRPFADVASIFGLFAKYPFDFVGIYLSHVFNGLDVKYPESYVSDFYRSRALFSFLNYTVIFVALSLLVLNFKSVFRGVSSDRDNFLLLLMFVVPVILVIPTQLEARFFLPVHLIFYAVCCFVLRPGDLFLKDRRFYLAGFLLYAAFVGLCFYVSSRAVPIVA